jgi:hypothetical protein
MSSRRRRLYGLVDAPHAQPLVVVEIVIATTTTAGVAWLLIRRWLSRVSSPYTVVFVEAAADGLR